MPADKFLIAFCGILQLTTILANGGPGHDWNYVQAVGSETPENWSKEYKQCAGRRQSPIDFRRTLVKTNSQLSRLNFINYKTVLNNLTMTNNGHTIAISVPKTYNLFLASTSLPVVYRLKDFHFHWPSEHTFTGQHAPLELHLVHSNTELPEEEFTTNATGLVVVAVIFKNSTEVSATSAALKAIVKSVRDVSEEGKSIPISGLRIADFLPNDLSYIRYSGSLTTPPCAETVEWHVLTQQQPVTPAQVHEFTGIMQEISVTENEEKWVKIDDNTRPVQTLNGRVVQLFGSLNGLVRFQYV